MLCLRTSSHQFIMCLTFCCLRFLSFGKSFKGSLKRQNASHEPLCTLVAGCLNGSATRHWEKCVIWKPQFLSSDGSIPVFTHCQHPPSLPEQPVTDQHWNKTAGRWRKTTLVSPPAPSAHLGSWAVSIIGWGHTVVPMGLEPVSAQLLGCGKQLQQWYLILSGQPGQGVQWTLWAALLALGSEPAMLCNSLADPCPQEATLHG